MAVLAGSKKIRTAVCNNINDVFEDCYTLKEEFVLIKKYWRASCLRTHQKYFLL